uniref:Nitrilase and fragile histidine triad fusion protein NitFhit n=1 Tax=Meloidogyne hapla TaxID=6305 RepID=A0A1I8BCS9_MELHA
MATSSVVSAGRRSLIAVCQLSVQHDLNDNFKRSAQLIERAATNQGCKMVFLPECFDYIGRNKEEQIDQALDAEGQYITQFRELAKRHGLWLALGGFHNKQSNGLPLNTYLLIDSSGQTRASYDKLHLFDLDLPGKVRLMESEFSRRGEKLILPVDTPIGRLGMGICYDLRFAELSLFNRLRGRFSKNLGFISILSFIGAQILSFPSSFTVATGLAHWEALLRARAIETQCYVIAPAQTGKHNDKRSSFGHSMVVDPWGAIIAQCSEREDLCFAELDLDYVDEVRRNQPVFEHRRSDLYSLYFNEKREINDSDQFPFAHLKIDGSQCFYLSAHCYAFVNLMPLLPGHVLISPLKEGAKRLTDLDDPTTADLFILTKKVERMLCQIYETNCATVCVQDGKHAGQTVEHVHVHIIPRKEGDFGGDPDQIYAKLQNHDAKLNKEKRSPKEMAEEARFYRKWFEENLTG